MRQTKKYLAAKARMKELKDRQKFSDGDGLYYHLETVHKQVWDSKSGEWGDRTQPRSMFGDDEPTGVIRLRVMAHPKDLHDAIHVLQGSNFKIVEVSDPYSNRRGSGERVYITAMLRK